MHVHFSNEIQLGNFWKSAFVHELQNYDVRLMCEDTFTFDLLCLAFETSSITSYARDALHYALVAEYRDNAFWVFLLNDTFNMESLFALDQADIVTLVLLMLESLNGHGFRLPRICYDLSAARCCLAQMTEGTKRLLALSWFEPIDYISQLLSEPGELE
jgi:hypothetical protein